MIIGDRDSVAGNYSAISARHLAPGQLLVHGVDPQRVDPGEGEVNVANDVLQLRRQKNDFGARGVVCHARARLATDVAVRAPAHCAWASRG